MKKEEKKKIIRATLCRVVFHDDSILEKREYLNKHSCLLTSELVKQDSGIDMLNKFRQYIHNGKITYIPTDYPLYDREYNPFCWYFDMFETDKGEEKSKIGYIAEPDEGDPYPKEITINDRQFLLLEIIEK